MDLCDVNHSESSEPSDNDSKMLNIFDEVAGDNSIQDQMYEFDAKEVECAEWNDLANNRKICENIVNAKQDNGAEANITKDLAEVPPKEMLLNEMIEFNSEIAGNSIMSQLQNIVENSKTTKTNAVQFEPKPERIQCSDSAVHTKRRLIIEEISVKKYNENTLPEAVDTTGSLKQDFVPGLESPVSNRSEVLEIASNDPESSVEIQSKLENIPETLFKHGSTQYEETTVDELTTENFASIEDISLAECGLEEFNGTDEFQTVFVDEHETQINSNDTSPTFHQSVSHSSDNEDYIASVFAVTEDYPDSPKPIPVALKYQELKTRDTNIDEHCNITFSGSSIEEISTSDESESDENDPQLTESSDTMQKFLSKYNVFLESMGSRLNHLREMTDQLRESRAQIDEELTQLRISRPTTTEPTGEQEEEDDLELTLYSDAENVECIDLTNRSDLIDRLLVTKSPLFDLSAEDVNLQVDALRDNNFNSTAEMIDRVYCQRDRYARYDEENSIKDYYETFGNFIDDDKAEALEIVEIERPEASHYLLDFEEAQMKERENGGRLTIYCENVDKLVVEDSRFTPDLVVGANIRGVGIDEDVPEELYESCEGYGEISIDR